MREKYLLANAGSFNSSNFDTSSRLNFVTERFLCFSCVAFRFSIHICKPNMHVVFVWYSCAVCLFTVRRSLLAPYYTHLYWKIPLSLACSQFFSLSVVVSMTYSESMCLLFTFCVLRLNELIYRNALCWVLKPFYLLNHAKIINFNGDIPMFMIVSWPKRSLFIFICKWLCFERFVSVFVRC